MKAQVYYEPVEEDGEFYLAKIDCRTKTIENIPFKDIEDMDDGKALQAYILGNERTWPYPSQLHPTQLLDTFDGMEPCSFDIEAGDYRERFGNVSERILHFLDRHMYFVGKYDAEICTNFILNSYFKDVFDYAPRLILSGTTDSGKSRVLDILEGMCYRGSKMDDATPASTFRFIDGLALTPILDEIQDYSKDCKAGMIQIFKSGIRKNGTVTRTEKHPGDLLYPEKFSVYGPMAVVNKSGGYLPEDALNRSITIVMIKNRTKNLPIRLDCGEMKAIRTELYTLRALWLIRPEYVKLEELYDRTIRELERGVMGRPKLESRCQDIASTYYTLSKLAGTEDAILNVLCGIQTKSADNDRDSTDGLVFRALIECLRARGTGLDNCRNRYTAITEITTIDVANMANDLQFQEGNSDGPYSKIKTCSVTDRLKAMGFAIDRGRTGNTSGIGREGIAVAFQTNLEKYGSPQDREDFSDRTGEIADNLTSLNFSVKNPVKKAC